MGSKECILCIFWLASGAPCWSECLLCLSDVCVSKSIHHIVCTMVHPNRQGREERHEGHTHLNKFQAPGKKKSSYIWPVEVKSKILIPLKLSCILDMLLVGDKGLPHNHCFELCLDQIRDKEVTVNKMLFPHSQRFSNRNKRHYKAKCKWSIWKFYGNKLKKIRRKIDKI